MEQSRIYSDYLRILRRSTDRLLDDPVREEIFSIERLEQYAAYLATETQVSKTPRRGRSLQSSLRENTRKLFSAYQSLTEAVRDKEPISPAAEWFVDNFFIIEDQLREIKQDLPENYYRELPKLASGELKGYPRIYSIALAIIAHTDSRLDADTLIRFVRSFQLISPLTIGELWALAITLRIALIEQLTPLAIRIVKSRERRQQANTLADKLLEVVAKGSMKPGQLIELLSKEIGRPENLDRAFTVQLIQRLRDQDPDIWPAFDWLEKQLEALDTSTDKLIQLEHFRQATAQVTVGNIISSMRLLSSLDWRELFEAVSLADPILAKDPAESYASMDFQTRDRYRHAIERISKRSHTDELNIARKAVEIAANNKKQNPNDERRAHVGYYLIGEGLEKFESLFAYQSPFRERFFRFVQRNPTGIYLGSLALLILLIGYPVLKYFYDAEGSMWGLVLFASIALLPLSEFALSLLNHYITFFIRPLPVPKMDTAKGIPEDAKTMVVIPTLFTRERLLHELIERLQVHFLANQDRCIYFALLTDFADASSESIPSDKTLLTIAEKEIAKLNERYCKDSEEARFYLFHRRRLWNESENKWIGWERKRGKLHEFNQLLRGAQDTSFIVNTAKSELLSQIKYVLTLDSDTQLPRDAAHHLIGTIIHPLNKPAYDSASGRITDGYGILQPRINVSLVSAVRSRFAHIFSGNTGLDPYTTAVSDVYQDLFKEGSFIGKGLYVVDTFENSLRNRVPQNTLLSHDLFEGSFARCALVTDVELFDSYPSNYENYSKRSHRWTRGDWQILKWIFARVPDAQNKMVPTQLSLIARWKIFDNLRRSLVAPAMVLWLLLAWTVLPGSPTLWTLFILLLIVFPLYAPITNSLLIHRRGIPWRSHFRNLAHESLYKAAQILISLCFLAKQAWTQTDAIARTLYRMFVSKKHLLEWVTFEEIEAETKKKPVWHLIGPGAILPLPTLLLILYFHPAALGIASPFLLAWMLGPLVQLWVGTKPRNRETPLSQDMLIDLRTYARRTWHFFETFVDADDNWLAPDNYQEDPISVVAHRTSPTNIGLQLLATLSAHDLGYLGTVEFTERLEKTFNSIDNLQKMHGHFFNWYDTSNLQPLYPQYISTVDSGNLAGHLLTLKQGLIDLAHRPLFHAHAKSGLIDTLLQLHTEITNIANMSSSSGAVTLKQLQDTIEEIYRFAKNRDSYTLVEWRAFLKILAAKLDESDDMLNALASEARLEVFSEARVWMSASLNQVNEFERDIQKLLPWIYRDGNFLKIGEMESAPEDKKLWNNLGKTLSQNRSLKNFEPMCAAVKKSFDDNKTRLEERLAREERPKAFELMAQTMKEIEAATAVAKDLLFRNEKLIRRCDEIVREMDFRFLFDEHRKIFVIGYNATDGRRDNSYYDLLASESRLASFVAIAKGEIPQEHWFRLGRQMTAVKGSRALISWTATMFEYLMPLLVMRRYSDTLLDQTYMSVVDRQIEYGKERSVPWGISEAGYNARDLQFNYQYGPFGVPGLGLKRGLSDDLVVSPYSTMLAAMIRPHAALANLQRLAQMGALSRYGFFESIDYTQARLPKKQKNFILRSFMAHHQGMSLVALNNILNSFIMHRRFHSDPLVLSTQLLLQEKIPYDVPLTQPRAEEVHLSSSLRHAKSENIRVYTDLELPTPRGQILSNGTYSVMVSSVGAGYSRCGRLAVSRWREDVTRDNWGHFFYIRNRNSGEIWSSGFHPTGNKAKTYEASFSEEKVELWRQDGDFTTHTEIIVAPEDNAELRRISITNGSSKATEFEITSYLETVLAAPGDDAAHPAFSNLFVQTEFADSENALLATRRKRSQNEKEVWGFHVVAAEGTVVGNLQYETDRLRFLGRGRGVEQPLVITEDHPLSNSVGAVLDPIFSLRQSILIPPGETMRLCFTTGIANSREEALRLADKYHDSHIFAREMELAWTKSRVQLRHLNIDTDKVHVYQRLACRILYSDPSLRPRSHTLAANHKSQHHLWAYGIGGDLPIVLTSISDEKDMDLVRELLHAHEYLRLKGLAFDLVILNEHEYSYAQLLQDELQRQIRISGAQSLLDKPGGIFIPRADIMPADDVLLLQFVARVALTTDKGTLEEQLKRRPAERQLPEALLPHENPEIQNEHLVGIPELQFFNGIGGFSPGGRQYVIVLKEGQWTPAPWVNVIANSKDFGFIVSESGSSYTWSINSRENRLTPWSNDAVSDPPGEVFYIRDEETGEFWTPTPLPIREKETYLVYHAQGYTQFEHVSHGISQELLQFVPLDAEVKISRLRLKNLSKKKRTLSVTNYLEWVLGFNRGGSAHYIITEVDEKSGTVLARNSFNNEFASRVAFAAVSERKCSITCDRNEFIGRNRTLANPKAMEQSTLSGEYGGGFDPCSAIQTTFELEVGEEHEILFILGQAESVPKALEVAEQYRNKGTAKNALKNVINFWDGITGTIEIKTPDLAMNTLFNRWLLYQTLVCRIWARSAFYQSGGAFGFRDQLQDVMALVISKPSIAREHILRAAARQFKEGDVQHWWHPPTGRGVRTHFSDDLIWLPYVVSYYINVTEDASILNEEIPFIDAPPLEAGQDDSYTQPETSTESATLFEHCARTLDRSLKVGQHGLPLMGSGDWNDGMNRVGHEGQGESVWVGWFLYTAMKDFIPFCEKAGETERTKRYKQHLTDLQSAIENTAWDGDWYRRAYFDNGAALGSALNEECRIDSIAQSWSVLSGAGNPQRSARAMAAVDEYLIDRADGLIKLFTPAFNKTSLDPGYIKGYLPGVRENGGQYTHAAIWTLMAFAQLGDGDRAAELYALINPINHAANRTGLFKYKVEPYVVAADIYGLNPHIGRGGWTWYTGSASWMYRSALECILGFELRCDKLRIQPRIPKHWPSFEIYYKYKDTPYAISVKNRDTHAPSREAVVEVDGQKLNGTEIVLRNDKKVHAVKIEL